jgi:hypothetical protein
MPDTPLQYFSTWLANHRRGELDAEIAVALAEVAGAAQQTGKAGSVTIVLSLKPNPNSDSVLLVDEVKVKRPEAARAAAIYYVGDSGQLQRDDPSQAAFFEEPVRSLGPETDQVRRAGGDQ